MGTASVRSPFPCFSAPPHTAAELTHHLYIRRSLQEAILENDLSLSVYKSAPPFTFTRDLTENALSPVLYFARNALNQRNGSMAIMNDASAGDPARSVLFSQLSVLTIFLTAFPRFKSLVELD